MQPQQHGERHFPLGAKRSVLRRAWRLTTYPIVKSLLGDKEFAIDQRTGAITNDGCKDTDLTVLCLAQPAIPLPRDASRLLAFLLQRGFVEDQGGAMAEIPIGILDQLIPHISAAPRRLTQHVMQALVVASRHLFGHPLQITPITLEPAMEIQAGCCFNRAGAALEAPQVGGKVGIKVRQRRINQRGDAVDILRTS